MINSTVNNVTTKQGLVAKTGAKLAWVVLCCAWLSIGLPAANAMSTEDARHLLHRTGFGVNQAQWDAIIQLDHNDAVDLLVDQATQSRAPTAPEWTTDIPLWTIKQRGWTPDQRRELRLKKRARIAELRVWWINQMLATKTPLQERMTLFWSNHFTTQYSKIYAPMLVYKQHALIRSEALGRFDTLLTSMLRDPAMLLYLDNDKNNSNSVNENLARELMELFTLGEGVYTERDVKEAARCLTGWGVARESGKFRIRTKRHDVASKTVLGQSGNFDGDGLARVLLARPETSERIVRKLWLEFISLEPDERKIKQWAAQFRKSDFALNNLLKTMLKSTDFRATKNRGVLVKSPVELYIGMIRPAVERLSTQQISRKIESHRTGKRLARLLKNAGQDLFDPPSVEGWPGGVEWIDSRTLLAREQTVRQLVVGLGGDRSGNNGYLAPLKTSGTDTRPMLSYLNAIDPIVPISNTLTQQRRLLELIRDPAVHLK